METFDPFKLIERPATKLFAGIYGPASGAALVVYEEGRGLRSLDSPTDRITAGEARFGKIRNYYHVDTTDHPLSFTATLPCSDDVGGFLATVRLQCRVVDSTGVVLAGIHDASSLIFPRFTDLLRRECQEFEAENWKAAEAASRRALAELLPEDYLPFRISNASLELRLSDGAARYVEERKESERNLGRAKNDAALAEAQARADAHISGLREQLSQDNLQLEKTRVEIEASIATQRIELEIERETLRKAKEFQAIKQLELDQLEFELVKQQRTAELDQQRLALALQRAELEADLDRQRVKVRLELEDIQVKQMTTMLENGEFERLAIQLVQNPADIDRINDYLSTRRNRDADRQLEALKVLIESDAVEGWQVSSQGKIVLQRLLESWSSQDRELTAGKPDQRVDDLSSTASPSQQPAPTVQQTGTIPSDVEPGPIPAPSPQTDPPPTVRQTDTFPGDEDAGPEPAPSGT